MPTPTSLADSTALIARYALREGAEIRRTTTVRAPCCGRVCAADMVADLRSIPGTVISPGQRGGPKRDVEFACDGCRGRLVREGGWKRSELKQARGYPPKEVRLERAKEMMRADRRKQGSNRGLRLEDYLEELRQGPST